MGRAYNLAWARPKQAKMTSSAWTANVWGQGKSALLATHHHPLKHGEDECMICRCDVPASVSFKPCGHVVCYACVENMRAKNIFKVGSGHPHLM